MTNMATLRRDNRQIKLAIGLPVYTGQIVSAAQRMWLSMGASLATSEARFQYLGTTLIETCGIDVARNRLVEQAWDQGADWLLMIDADTWHEQASDILQMISDADRWTGDNRFSGFTGRAAAVAAQVPKRDPDDTHLMVYRYIEGKRTPVKLGHGLERIDAAATAMMAININFLRESCIVPPWFRFEWEIGHVKPTRSEDLHFCKLVRDAGGAVLGDGRFVAKHMQRPQVIG